MSTKDVLLATKYLFEAVTSLSSKVIGSYFAKAITSQ